MLRVGEHAHIHLVTVIPCPLALRRASPDWVVFHCALDKVINQDGTCQLTFVPETQGDMMCRRRTTLGRTPSAREGH